MEDTVKLKWYFRLFSKLDNEACNVDMTNRAVAWGIDWIAGSLITAFPTVIFYMALTKHRRSTKICLHLISLMAGWQVYSACCSASHIM